MKIKKALSMILFVFTILTQILFVSCTSTSDTDMSENSNYIKITDQGGDEVLVPKQINSIATTSVPCFEMMIAFGLGDKITATYKTSLDNPWLELVFNDPDKLTVFESYDPEAESLLASNTDLTIVPTVDRARVLRDHGVCAICMRYYNSEEVIAAAKLLGEIFGGTVYEKSEKWISYLTNTIKETEKMTSNIDENNKPVCYEIMGDKYRGLYRTNYGDSQIWLKYGGGIIATRDFPTMDKGDPPTNEAILATNPDVIFIGGTYSMKLKDDLYDSKEWKNITAVKNKQVYIVPVGPVAYWNDYSIEYPLMVKFVFSCLYPEKVNFSLIREAHDFFLEFYDIDLTDIQMDYLLKSLSPNGDEIGR